MYITFDRRANESGLYNVDSSWPTEYWVVKKTIASGRMQADRNTQRIYDEQQYVKSSITQTTMSSTGYDNYTDNTHVALARSQIYRPRADGPGGWLARTANGRLAHSGYYAFGSLTSRWSFGPRNGHPSMSAQGVYLTPDGAGRCQDNDLADGMRVLSSSYPRLLATSPRPGHTD
ncbi:hypothetical protein T01_9963 [Trichinella spiralis]|uniref:Uncharacterized protein n=1 Tax=Trichinella spiralis TaxID=6334 RepID=A0A0V1BN50_TRISP|nr:hypothetical protein T01_9963 [Trichinella spiralis]